MDRQYQIPVLQSLIGMVLSLVATVASGALVLTEIRHYQNPAAELSCDINPLIGCGESLNTSQAHLLAGIPNALIGVAVFSVLVGLFAALVSGANLSTWLWNCLGIGGLAGVCMVAFFLEESVRVFQALCPLCLVVWTCTIPLAVILTTTALYLQFGEEQALVRAFYRNQWLIVVGLFLLVIIIIVAGLGSKLAQLF